MGVGCLSYRAVHDGTNAPKGAKNAWRFLAPIRFVWQTKNYLLNLQNSNF